VKRIDDMEINKILLHCYNESIAELLQRNLDRPQNIIIKSQSLTETAHTISKSNVDAVIIECNKNSDEVIEIINETLKKDVPPAIVVIGSNTNRDTIIELVNHGCTYIVENMVELHSIDKLVSNLIENRKLELSKDRSTAEPKRLIEVLEKNPEFNLSRRELEILFHLIQGKQNKAISKELGISEKTVKNHLWKIYRKFGVDNRTELFNLLLKRCACMQLISA